MPQSELIKKLKILANDLVIDSIELVKNKENYKECIGGSYFKFPTKENVKEFKKNNKRFLLSMLKLPNNKKFIFTIIDDTDDAFSPNIDKVYDVLIDNGLKTTKTVWVFPVRDNERSKGDCLQNDNFKKFILKIKAKGFEIGLHNVGSGDLYKREEIIKGLTAIRRNH